MSEPQKDSRTIEQQKGTESSSAERSSSLPCSRMSEGRQQLGAGPRSGVGSRRLEPSFLRMVVVATMFKPDGMRRIEAALVALSLTEQAFTAAELPDEVTAGDRHLPGCATGGLLAAGVLTCIGRVKSPNKDAKGRKVDLLRATSRELSRTWLKRNGIDPEQIEGELRPAFALECQ